MNYILIDEGDINSKALLFYTLTLKFDKIYLFEGIKDKKRSYFSLLEANILSADFLAMNYNIEGVIFSGATLDERTDRFKDINFLKCGHNLEVDFPFLEGPPLELEVEGKIETYKPPLNKENIKNLYNSFCKIQKTDFESLLNSLKFGKKLYLLEGGLILE